MKDWTKICMRVLQHVGSSTVPRPALLAIVCWFLGGWGAGSRGGVGGGGGGSAQVQGRPRSEVA